MLADKYRVLHLVNGEFYAGAERVQDLLALRLPAMGFDVGFACLKNGIFAGKRESQSVPLCAFPMAFRIDFAVVRKLATLIRRDHYQLIHTHSPRAALIGRLLSGWLNVPMVHHVHSPVEKDTEHGWKNRRNSIVEKFSLGRAEKLIAVSASLQSGLLKRGIRPERVRLVPNGVPMRPKSRKNYVPGSPLIVGMVALFRPRKGIEVLLEALASLNSAGCDVLLHAVGPFETREYQLTVESLVGKLGLTRKIVWTGFKSNVGAELQNMHVFVVPSLYGEGMPMVMLEAMSAGLPVIGTRVEGIPEVVRDKQEGLLVEPGSVNGLANAIRQVAAGDYNAVALGDSGWLRQRAVYSDVNMAEGVASVYREILQ
jgi:glycosyltransferase involved in cell wall biosynthesis